LSQKRHRSLFQPLNASTKHLNRFLLIFNEQRGRRLRGLHGVEAVLCLCLATGQAVDLPSEASKGLAVLIWWCPQTGLHAHAVLGQQCGIYAVGLAVLQLDIGEVLGALGGGSLPRAGRPQPEPPPDQSNTRLLLP
tara:strand:- start:737 stop:1144 length:408 start_codon:yes stop_codon:yes gene_type:complete